MKILYLILTLLALLCVAVVAPAQQYTLNAIAANSNGGTNTVTALVTNSFGALTLTKYGDVALDLSFKAHTSGYTSNLVFNIWESLDGTNAMTTAPRYVVAIAATSTTTVRWVTNFTVGPVGYLIVQGANTNASGVFTNVAAYYAVKPKRFGF